MLGGPRWPIFTSISGTSINKLFTTYFRLSSLSFRLSLIPFAIYSLNSILHAIVEKDNLTITL